MTTDTPARDKLSDFPCPWRSDSTENPQPRHSYKPCDGDCLDDYSCPALPIFRAHIKLRDDMRKLRRAVLGEMTPAGATQMYRRYADWEHAINKVTHGPDKAHFDALADAVAKLGNP